MISNMISSAEMPARSIEPVLMRVPIEAVVPNPNQPRKTFSRESIEELAQSIRQHGLIQPITVRQMSGYYELIAGERRLRAVRELGLKQIMAIVQPTYEEDSAFMALVENLQRENLHFLEEAQGYQNLINNYSLTQEELARRVSKNQSTIANKLRILKLSDAVKNAMVEAHLTERHARALLRMEDEREQIHLIDTIRQKGLSVKDTEREVERVLRAKAQAEEEADAQEQRPRIIRLFKDYRLFVNTVKNAVFQLREAGLNADLTLLEEDDEIIVKVVIPKGERN